jgi:hypothetical protein
MSLATDIYEGHPYRTAVLRDGLEQKRKPDWASESRIQSGFKTGFGLGVRIQTSQNRNWFYPYEAALENRHTNIFLSFRFFSDS